MTGTTRKLALAGLLAAAVSAAGAGPAAAADAGSLTCSTADQDEIFCTGSVMDATVAGRGVYRLGGSYMDDTCLVGNGKGSIEFNLPVVTVLGERTLTVEADYGYVRTGAVRIANGYADATLTDYPLTFFGESRAESGETRRLPFSSVAVATGEPGLDGCPLLTPSHWVEQIALGSAAQGAAYRSDPSGGGSGVSSGLKRGACANPQSGTSRADRLTGTAAGDALSGRGGGDSLVGIAGDDCLDGGKGADSLKGGGGHDALRAGAGSDTLRGGRGSDALRGGRGVDTFAGGSGRDVIDSRDGLAETVSCGAGKDSARADAGDRLSGCEARLIAD